MSGLMVNLSYYVFLFHFPPVDKETEKERNLPKAPQY